jgi:glucose-6-phosphate 1-dehydrogenase
MVIFGAAGDLTKRKLVPALYHLCAAGLLPERFAMVGVSREQMDTEHYRDLLQREAKKHLGEEFTEDLWNHFIERCYYLHGDFRDPDSYRRLADKLGELDQQCQTPGNYLFYLATPPSLFADITAQLASVELSREQDGRWRRVIIEKPFGRNLESARALNHKLHEMLEESQIYRIDHYLGKETVQNIMAFRFANGISGTWSLTTCWRCCPLSPWNRRYPSMPMRYAVSNPRCCVPRRHSRPKRYSRTRCAGSMALECCQPASASPPIAMNRASRPTRTPRPMLHSE